MALYCLLEVAIGVLSSSFADTVLFPFIVDLDYLGSRLSVVTRSLFRQKKKFKMSRPELQAPPEIVRRFLCPSFLSIRNSRNSTS